MKLTDTDRHEPFFDHFADWFGIAVRAALNLLMLIVTFALIVGIVKSGINLVHNLGSPLETILQDVLLDTVFIVALVEIAITILGYLKDGRVHVRYIVDTVLIIMLNEIVSMWFKHPTLPNAISLSVIVTVLAAIRVSVTKFIPRDEA